MPAQTYAQLVEACRSTVREIMPWDLVELLESAAPPLLLDVREPQEYNAMHIPDSINVPRGLLEGACDWGYEETVPVLARAQRKPVVVICRSGNRSVLAAHTMLRMGYENVVSLKTGVRGWNDYEQPLVDNDERPVDIDAADEFLASTVKPEQLKPKDESAGKS